MNLKTKSSLVVVALFSSLAFNANAGIVTNDTQLISADYHEQLAQWKGSDFDLTRIFAKGVDGDTSEEWHSIVDNKGATFTIMEIFNGDERMVIGGYSKFSWNLEIPQFDSTNKESFLFNLSTGIKYQKNDYTTDVIHNQSHLGARFGVGDLSINSTLSSGTTNIGHSYGDRRYFGDEDYRDEFTGSFNSWVIGDYETYLISSPTGDFGTGATPSGTVELQDVPFEKSMAALGLVALFFSRKNKKTAL